MELLRLPNILVFHFFLITNRHSAIQITKRNPSEHDSCAFNEQTANVSAV